MHGCPARAPARIALVGYGALGHAFATGFRAGRVADVRVFARERSDAAGVAVRCHATFALRDGRIVEQTTVQAWDS